LEAIWLVDIWSQVLRTSKSHYGYYANILECSQKSMQILSTRSKVNLRRLYGSFTFNKQCNSYVCNNRIGTRLYKLLICYMHHQTTIQNGPPSLNGAMMWGLLELQINAKTSGITIGRILTPKVLWWFRVQNCLKTPLLKSSYLFYFILILFLNPTIGSFSELIKECSLKNP
jgi:hypothetical protein